MEWYRDAPARDGRAPPAGNDGGDGEAVEDGEGGGGADDAGGFVVQSMDE